MLDLTDHALLDEPDLTEPLSESAAEAYVGRTCFKTGPPARVGVELEWLVHDAVAPRVPVPLERVRAALTELARPASSPSQAVRRSLPPHPPSLHSPSRSAPPDERRPGPPGPAAPLAGRLTTEPGGQLELSSLPAPLVDCLRDTAAELALLRDQLAEHGLVLAGLGLDPHRPPVRRTGAPRYAAMEQHFDRRGPHGRVMMCSTASVQVCLDAGGSEQEIAERWRALYALAPVFVALFANSPLQEGRSTGWRCTRQAVWSRIDPSRTRPPAVTAPPAGSGTASRTGPDLRSAYAQYALDAELLAVRRRHGRWDAPAGLTFRRWLRGEASAVLRPPTLPDLDFHLSTLFPPIRPRGHLEVRVIDAQPAAGWRIVAAVVASVIDDPGARDAALAAAEPVAAQWSAAARSGLANPRLADAARAVLAAALAGMSRAHLPADLTRAVELFAERYPERGRSPADDVLDRWSRGLEPLGPATRQTTCTGHVQPTGAPGEGSQP